MNPVFIEIFGFKIHYYGLMYAVAFYIGIELAKKLGKEKGISDSIVESYGLVAMISGLIGGRLYYVLFNLPFYLVNPKEIIAVWNGGMAIHGGIIGGIMGTFIYSHFKKISPYTLGDIMAPSVLLGQGIGRIGNLMNGEIHGVPTFTPWRVIFNIKPIFYSWYEYYLNLPLKEKGEYRELVPWGIVFPESSPAGREFPNLPLHPAMIYEMILNFIGFFLLWFVYRKRKRAQGTLWWTYIVIYSLIRIFVSFFRAEDLMMLGIRAPHVVSTIMILISILIIKLTNKGEI